MAKIISMSLPEDVLAELDALTTEIGFSGRSEAIRAGVRLLNQEHKERTQHKGTLNATLSIIHYHKRDMSLLMHTYQDIIITHLHNHLDKEKCLDIFVLKGNASRIRKLVESFEKDKSIRYTKLHVV